MRSRRAAVAILGTTALRGTEAFLETVWLKQHEVAEEQRLIPTEAAPRKDTFVGYVGRLAFKSVVNKPTPRLLLRLVAGVQPDEATTLFVVAMACNLVYCAIIVVAFLALPRGTALALGAATFAVGPALVFVVFGCLVVIVCACAAYPMTVVATLWLANFAKTTAFQWLALRLRLDLDRDGDVDLLDFFGFIAHTRLGRLLRLPALHRRWNAKTDKPVQQLAHKIDTLDLRVKALTALVEDLIALKKREDQAHAHRSNLWESAAGSWGHDDLGHGASSGTAASSRNR